MRYNSLSRKGLVDVESEIVNLYNQHLPIKEICLKLNIGKSTVHNYLKKNDKRRQILHTFDDDSFSTFTSENCYWAGFIAADGCIDKKGYSCRVDLHIDDRHHIEKLLKFTKDKNLFIKNNTKVATFKDGKSYKINHCYADINSVKIIKDLINNFNVTSVKSFTLQPPREIPKELVKHFIRGYFDGDGSIYWNKSHKCGIFQISSGSKDLLKWVSCYIKEQVSYEFSDESLNLRKNDSIYYISSSHKQAQAILNWLYDGSTKETRLDRKYERYLSYMKNKEI